jgi:hypothetical protein
MLQFQAVMIMIRLCSSAVLTVEWRDHPNSRRTIAPEGTFVLSV